MSAVADDPHVVAAREAGASDSDIALIATLKQKAAEFEAARQRLLATGAAVARSGDSALMLEYGELVARADALKARVQFVVNAIESALRFARGALGLEGAQLRALGVWFLPAAIVLGAIAALGHWVNDYLKFARRFDELDRVAAELEAEGVDPIEARRQAAAVVATAAQGALGTLARSLIIVALVGGGVWFLTRNR